MQRAFLSAAQKAPLSERSFSIGGRTLRFCFAGLPLVESLCRAFLHLETQAADPFAAFYFFDSASTGIPMPDMPFPVSKTASGTIEKYQFADEDICIQYAQGSRSVFCCLYHRKQKIGIFWVPSNQKIIFGEGGAAIQPLLYWMLRDTGLQLIHAGAVGTPEGAVILAGRGGSGKTTTTLACLNSTLRYLGDDFIAVKTGPDCRVFSLYQSAKIDPPGLFRFPQLQPLIQNPSSLEEEKAMIFLASHYPEKILTQSPVRAIVLPRIAGGLLSRLSRVSPALSLRLLAPSTMIALPDAGPQDLKRMTELVMSMPSYLLELGDDISAIPALLLPLIKQPQV